MDARSQTVSWYDTMMTYSLLSSDYPSIIRYISGAFIALGFIFVGPIILLIGVDFVIYIYRLCWCRPWSPNQNQSQNQSQPQSRELGQQHKRLPEEAGGTTAVTPTVAAAARKRIQRLSEPGDGNDAMSS
ncbi:hypothetical protein EsH8_X_000259 [Colletotrichum jinshuiense]